MLNEPLWTFSEEQIDDALFISTKLLFGFSLYIFHTNRTSLTDTKEFDKLRTT